MIGDVDHVGVVVADLASARRFVAEVLGFEHRHSVEIPGRLRAEFFTKGSCELELIEVSEPAERAARLRPGAKATLDHVALQASDVGAAVRALGGLGVEFDRGGMFVINGHEVAFTVAETSEGVRYQLVGP